MGTLEPVWVPNGGKVKKERVNTTEQQVLVFVFVKSGKLQVHVCLGGIYNDRPYPFILVQIGSLL